MWVVMFVQSIKISARERNAARSKYIRTRVTVSKLTFIYLVNESGLCVGNTPALNSRA